ncbi:hypothetical protein [Leucobacter chromiiresistens]|uniref:DUF7882 domain-containing protein n=1 Tax=Leucobacter chromiiresistens TaxID=1079994 RepID=A0A1H0ZED4_9MICO|nr:hypothetical protein [Leucobacter chromiiresistens]SDQ25798.1 hypothetical protein SAMN04488565_1684 [Leucobacter chromiiresistens]
MGNLVHGGREYEFEDRLLAHLQFVIGQKLKKQECFFLSWHKPHDQGDGRLSIWLSPYTTVAFRFSGSRDPELSKVWVRALNALAHTPRGLVAITEEEAERYVKKNPDLI